MRFVRSIPQGRVAHTHYVAIIGAAQDHADITKTMFQWCVFKVWHILTVKWGLDPSRIVLVSGGSAFMDHIAVALYLAMQGTPHAFAGLELYLPEEFLHVNAGYLYQFRAWSNEGRTLNELHGEFERRIGKSTLFELGQAEIAGARLFVTEDTSFKKRNTQVAQRATHAVALTWFDTGDDLAKQKSGGTRDTWLKFGKDVRKIHVSLHSAGRSCTFGKWKVGASVEIMDEKMLAAQKSPMSCIERFLTLSEQYHQAIIQPFQRKLTEMMAAQGTKRKASDSASGEPASKRRKGDQGGLAAPLVEIKRSGLGVKGNQATPEQENERRSKIKPQKFLSMGPGEDGHERHGIWLYRKFYSKAEADEIYRMSRDPKHCEWKQYWLNDGEMKQPRLNCSFSKDGAEYKYRDLQIPATPFGELANKIDKPIIDVLGLNPSYYLGNRYQYESKNPEDTSCIHAHSDDETGLDPMKPIVSVSVGATAYFDVWRIVPAGVSDQRNERALRIILQHGDVLLMMPGMQSVAKHAVPRPTQKDLERIHASEFRLRFNYTGRHLGGD